MADYNLYQGAFTGLTIDRCIQRINSTPQNTPIPFMWVIAVTVTGTAGSDSWGASSFNPGSFSYQSIPNFNNCEVIDVQMSNPGIVRSVSVSQYGQNTIEYSLSFIASGSTDIYIYLIEGAAAPTA